MSTDSLQPASELASLRQRVAALEHAMTEKARLGASLRDNAELFRLLIEFTDNIISLHEPDGTFLYVSPAHEALTGYPAAEIIGQDAYFLIHPDDHPHIRHDAHAALLRGESIQTEWRGLCKDGSIKWIRTQASWLPPAEDRPGRILCVSRDITADKQGAEQAHNTHELLTQLLDNAPAPVFIIGEDGAYRLVNKAWENQFQLSRQQVIGLKIRALFPAETARQMEEANRCVLEMGRPLRLEERSELPGGMGYAYTVKFPLHNAAGVVDAVGGIAIDITERKQAEEALRRSEAQYRTLVENLPDVVGRYRRDLTILYMSPSVLHTSGKPPEYYIGRRALDIVGPDPTIQVWVAAMERVFETGQPEEIEYTYPTQNGARQFKTRLVPEIEKGTVETVLCISQDITESRRAEAQRLELERRIQETQRLESLGVLAGGVAHDFNNLLMAITGYAELARMELPPDSPARDAVEKIETVTQRAADLTRQVLAYAGRGRVVVAPLLLNELVSEMAQLIRVSIPKTARLETRLAPNLPPIDADATQIRQIVMNLVLNAAEALHDGEGTITLTTETFFANRTALEALAAAELLAEGDYAVLEVRDTGIGMSAETLAHIFEPFFTTKFTGRGLGLAAAQGIARSHGGALLVQSEPGQGTTFRLLLPVTAVLPNAAPAKEADASLPASKVTVLVVEDEAAVRAVLVQMLQKCGYAALEASDGASALELLNTYACPVGCVLLDLTMPGWDGRETRDRIRAAHPEIPVLLMSGYSEAEIGKTLPDEAAADVLQKPFNRETLQTRLRQILSRK